MGGANAVDLPLPFGGVDRPSPVVVEHPAEPLTYRCRSRA